MNQNLIKHPVLILTKHNQFCMNNRYGNTCMRKVNTGFCWQHYPQIKHYNNPTDIQTCVRKLLNLSRLARSRTAKISIVQAIFEVVSHNKWYLISNPDFYQNVVHKYHAYKESCELARYCYLEQALSNEPWHDDQHYWSFPTSKRKPNPSDSCYSL